MHHERHEVSSTISCAIGVRMSAALALLTDVALYATDLACDPWQFGVTISELRAAGLSDNDLRWLIGKGHIEQCIEITERGEPVRSFRPAVGAVFSERACFILTAGGQAFARELFGTAAGTRIPAPSQNGHATLQPATDVKPAGSVVTVTMPTWDRDRLELRFGTLVVKQFKVPSPNQETILAAFEEERWPPRIDDPLPPQPALDPKRRLHDTINTLNRNQKNALIRFLGDGTGQGVRWEPWASAREWTLALADRG
jgi:hypothetical protein